MKIDLRSIVTHAIKQQDPFLDQPVDLSDGDDALLYVDGGQIDSLSLVTIIADIEKLVMDKFGINIRIANERDLSIQNSPFATFGKMLALIESRLNDSRIQQGGTAY